MKRQIFRTIFGITFIVFSALSLNLQNAEAQSIQGAFISGGDCKVEVLSCGWGSGSRQVCHQNGDGVACTCGDSTKCPDNT